MKLLAELIAFFGILLAGWSATLLLTSSHSDQTHTTWHGFQTPHPATTKNQKGQYDC